MNTKKTANFVASAVALVVLMAAVSLAAYYIDREHFYGLAIAGCLFAIPLAVAAWAGTLFKGGDGTSEGPATWREWIVVFLVGASISAVFVAIDLAVRHPGFSLIFTVAAIAMTFIALPSAIRSWLLEALLAHNGGSDDDT